MKVAIPATNTGDDQVDRFAEAVKLNMESMMGQNKNSVKLSALPSTATNADIINQLNAILARIQG